MAVVPHGIAQCGKRLRERCALGAGPFFSGGVGATVSPAELPGDHVVCAPSHPIRQSTVSVGGGRMGRSR